MKRFAVHDSYEALCQTGDMFAFGELHHVARNRSGGAVLTPVGRFFCTRPLFIEGFNEHWRVDCYVREHRLAPEPALAGKCLVAALKRESICLEPIWVSWYSSKEHGGEAQGEVYAID